MRRDGRPSARWGGDGGAGSAGGPSAAGSGAPDRRASKSLGAGGFAQLLSPVSGFRAPSRRGMFGGRSRSAGSKFRYAVGDATDRRGEAASPRARPTTSSARSSWPSTSPRLPRRPRRVPARPLACAGASLSDRAALLALRRLHSLMLPFVFSFFDAEPARFPWEWRLYESRAAADSVSLLRFAPHFLFALVAS